MDPQAIIGSLATLDDETLLAILAQLLQGKPQLAPELVKVMIPDLTYAPAKALTERRSSGTIKKINQQGGYGFVSCPELQGIFGCDVFVNKAQIRHFAEGQEITFAVLLNKDNKPQAFELQDESAGKGAAAHMMMSKGMGGGVDVMCGKGIPSLMSMPPATMMPMGKGMGMMPMGGDFKGVGKGDKGAKGGKAETVIGRFPGIVRSYNLEKGFGFVTCPDLTNQGMPGDVYLHNSHVHAFQVGQEVTCEVYLFNGRPQCRGLEDATGQLDPAAHAAAAFAQAQAAGAAGAAGFAGAPMPGVDAGMKGGGKAPSSEVVLGSFLGTVKSFNQEKGYGFLTCEDLAAQGYGEAYVHAKNMVGHSVAETVSFTAYLFNGKLQGRDLQGLGTDTSISPEAMAVAQAQGWSEEPPAKLSRFS